MLVGGVEDLSELVTGELTVGMDVDDEPANISIQRTPKIKSDGGRTDRDHSSLSMLRMLPSSPAA